MIYEFSVPKGALGGTCGAVTLAGAHNSPSKNDDNLGTLGDRVWLDENANGIQEPSEVGIPKYAPQFDSEWSRYFVAP